MSQSTADPRYQMANLMGIVDGTTGADQLSRPGERTYVIDVLSQRWQEILNGIQLWQEYTYVGEKLSTTCYRYHGTESTYRLVLDFNGVGTPMELRPGMLLRIPLKSELDRLIAATSPTADAGSTLNQLIRI